MKIGIFDPYLDTLSGGEKYMLTIAKCLELENRVFLFWDTQEEQIRQKALNKLAIDLSRVKFVPNIFSPRISLFNRIKESLKYDKIIYLSDGSIPFVSSKLYVHFQFPIEFVGKPSLKMRFKLKRVSRFFCNSLFTQKYIDKALGIKSAILYPPVYLKKTRKIKKENIILHVGRFGISSEGVNYKKQDIMINAFKKMVDSNLKDWQLVLIIGSRDHDQEKLQLLERMIEGYPIKIINNPPNDFLWEQYARAKIYWHASGFGEDLEKYPQRAEHFGISTVEAMGKGIVPVVIARGGQTEIVEDGKNGFLWRTIDELIRKTRKLIKEPSLLEQLSKRASFRSKKFVGNRFCKELKQIIC